MVDSSIPVSVTGTRLPLAGNTPISTNTNRITTAISSGTTITPTQSGNASQGHLYTGSGTSPGAAFAPTQGRVNFPASKPTTQAVIETGTGAKPATIAAVRSLPGVDQAWIGNLSHNEFRGKGNHEAAIITPQGLDPSKPVKVMYYFHGLNGTIPGALGKTGEGFGPELMEWAKKNNAVIVMPQGPADDSQGLIAKQPKSWLAGDQVFSQLNQEVMGKIGKMLPPGAQIASVELAGHSAGGIAVRNALEGLARQNPPTLNGPNGQKISVGKAHFLDATYSDHNSPTGSNRAEDAYKALQKINPQADFKVAYLKGQVTDKGFSQGSAASYLTTSRTQFQPITGIEHGAVPKYYFSR